MTKLKDLCRTRWIECIDALDQVKYLHSSIVVCFESISAEDSHKWSPDSLTDASTLLLAITTTDFISTLVITNECLHYFLGLTRSLQQEAKDIVQAVSEVEVLTSSLKEVRENVDSHHSEWFKTISDMCSKVGTTPSLGYVVISVTDQTPRLLLLSSILGERLQSQFLTTFSLSSTDGSLLTK